jgi:hypothetical protein
MEVDPVISSEWFIEEASRVLKADGILVATINNKSSPRAVSHEAFRPGEAQENSGDSTRLAIVTVEGDSCN